MAADDLNRAKTFLAKAEEYLASAEDNLAAARYTPAAGDAVHAGISAKDAILTALTGQTAKAKDHSAAVKELRIALAKRPDAALAEKAMRELVSAKSDIEYGSQLMTRRKAEPLVRRAQGLVTLAIQIVRLGG